MIHMWFRGINYYKLTVEEDCDSILRPYGNQAQLHGLQNRPVTAGTQAGVTKFTTC